MRFLSFTPPDEDKTHVGILLTDTLVIDLSNVGKGGMLEFIRGGPKLWGLFRNPQAMTQTDDLTTMRRWELDEVTVQSPLARPTSLRDFYAFEEHVATASANRGREVPKNWYKIPVFYFSNTNAIYGPDQDVPIPTATQEMDFELEVAAIIGVGGRDIPVKKAMEHVFGFTILNDWSARDLQRQEMSVGLGPAKGKDFASSLGPYVVTLEELAHKGNGRPGVYDLEMTARINGKEVSRGNWKDLHYSFGEMIARASEAVTLEPGDVIGSGTVGTGTLLEITRNQGPWLQSGDVVELEVEMLGVLRNTVR